MEASAVVVPSSALTYPLGFPSITPVHQDTETLRRSLTLLGSVALTVTGDSMIPTLHHLRDAVVLAPIKADPENIKRSDIIYAQRPDGSPVMHRVLKVVAGGVIRNGDGQMWLEGPIPYRNIYAKVIMFRRGGKLIPVNSFGMRMYGHVWLTLRPFRRWMFTAIRRIKAIFHIARRTHATQ